MKPTAYPEILSELAACILQCLHDSAVEPADRLSAEITEAIRLRFGGGLIYIPMGKAYLREQRDAGILKDFDGRNHAALAHRYRVTVSTVYEVLKHARTVRNPHF